MGEPHQVVLLIDQLDVFGGTELHVYHMTRALMAQGHRVALWTFLDGELYHKCVAEGLPVRYFHKTGVLRPDGLRLLGELSSALGEFCRGKPTILQTYHTASDLLGPLLSQRHACVTTLSTRRDMGFIRKAHHDMLQRGLNRWVSRVLVVSEAVKWIVARREGADPRRIEVIPNGIDTSAFFPATTPEQRQQAEALRQSLGAGSEQVVVATVGTLRILKGQGALIAAVARLRRQGRDVVLWMVGKGDDEELFKAQAKREGVEDAVVFLGQRGDVPEILRAADVFGLMSHSEGFSNAVIEAMAAGLPVVVTDVGGNRSAVRGKAGAVVAVNDVEAMARELSLLCDEPQRRLEAGRAARAIVLSDYTVDRMVERYLAIHRDALAGRQGASA